MKLLENLFKIVHAEILLRGFRVSTLRSDNGGEFTSAEFTRYLEEEHIVPRYTPPYTPNANSVSERFNYTLAGRVRAMLSSANLAKFLWSEAVQTSTMIYNILPWKDKDGKSISPFERLFKTIPDASRLRAYGCVAYAYNFNTDINKLDNRAIKGCLVGYDSESAAYRIYLPTQHKLIRSAHVKFNEHALYYSTAPIETAHIGRSK